MYKFVLFTHVEPLILLRKCFLRGAGGELDTVTVTVTVAWGDGVGVGVPQTSDGACCPRAGTPPPGFNFNSTSNRRSLTMHAGHSAASRAHWSRRSENALPTNCSANPADPCCARCWARYGQPSPEMYQSYDVGELTWA